jgi:hypothetical protein
LRDIPPDRRIGKQHCQSDLEHGRHRPAPGIARAYAHGISAPSLSNNPSARVVSDILNNQTAAPITISVGNFDMHGIRLRCELVCCDNRYGPIHGDGHEAAVWKSSRTPMGRHGPSDLVRLSQAQSRLGSGQGVHRHQQFR